jgi:NAD(P)-dependent dehydrogenase (short-subunit alcohol dehydrogenase family)
MELQALKAQHGDKLIIQQMDTTKPEEITACAAAVAKQVPCLHLLFNVSGLLHIPGTRTNATLGMSL